MESYKVLLCWFFIAMTALAIEPEAIYNGGFNTTGNSSILLKIGNGGAGQSGLIKALADAFVNDSVSNGSAPFSIAWYKSDTTISINYLKTGLVDIGLTYSPAAEKLAIDQGIALSPSYYAWRDHFLIVGPPSNPANLTKDGDVLAMMAGLYQAAEKGGDVPTRWLSRFDKSATNIKESSLWLGIGQVPWSTPYSTWYHQYIAYPIQALTAAITLQEYTLTDRGTYLSLSSDLQKQTQIYKASSDAEDDLLLNPAHALIGTKAENAEMARKFVKWLVGPQGQGVIGGFKKGGEVLYSGAPGNVTCA
ncbi:putative extracellular tungstate binding protein [Halenospora varia]|nr:putative extracellular tungstate binding protein [Halenospora varia]